MSERRAVALVAFPVPQCWAFLWSLVLFGLPLAVHGADEPTIVDPTGCKAWNPYPEPDEGVLWSGDCRNGWMEGSGTLQWFFKDKLIDSYETTMRRGRMNGFTKATHVVARILVEADFVDGKAQGFGIVTNVMSGVRYIGDLWDGNRNGWGVEQSADGSRAEGFWKDNLLSGLGTVTASGHQLNGIFTKGQLNGPGVMHFLSSGHRVETTFENGMFLLGSACREFDQDGGFIVGKVKLNKDNSRQCRKSFGASVADFLMASATAINAYAAANGYQWSASTADPYAIYNQMLIAQQQSGQQNRGGPMYPAPTTSAADLQRLREQLALRSRETFEDAAKRSAGPIESPHSSSSTSLSGSTRTSASSSTEGSWRYSGPGCAPNLTYLRSQIPLMLRMLPETEKVLSLDIDAAIQTSGLDRALVSMRIQRDQVVEAIQNAKACADEIAPGGRGGIYPRVTGEPRGAREQCLVKLQISEEQLLLNDAMIAAYECRRGR